MTKWERLKLHYIERVERCKERGLTDTSAYRNAVSVLSVMDYLDICEEHGELDDTEGKRSE